jgi:hypothetical protein
MSNYSKKLAAELAANLAYVAAIFLLIGLIVKVFMQ